MEEKKMKVLVVDDEKTVRDFFRLARKSRW